MKIFLGMFNIASLFVEYTKGFKALGHEVFSVDVQAASPIIDHSHTTLHLPSAVQARLREEKTNSDLRGRYWHNYYYQFAWQKACEADVCLFMWATFKNDFSDLIKLKQLGKKIIVRFVGSESRILEMDQQRSRLIGKPCTSAKVTDSLDELRKKLYYIRMAEKYADIVLGPSEHLRPNYNNFFMISTDNIPFKAEQRQVPVILHGPSDSTTKGSWEWMEILNGLRDQGLNFEVRLAADMEHEKFLQEYAKADIHLGGLYIGGKAELEAIAAGCVALAATIAWPYPWHGSRDAYIDQATEKIVQALQITDEAIIRQIKQAKKEEYERISGYYKIVQRVNKDSAAGILAELITDRDKRQKLALQGHEYVKKYCRPQDACKNMLDALSDPDSWKSHSLLDYPDFFYDHYIPRQDPIWLSAINQSINIARNCGWYKQYIKPRQRAGLVF